LIFFIVSFNNPFLYYYSTTLAIKETKREIGFVEIGERDDLQFAHGRLNIGEAISPPLVRAVKEYKNPTGTVIIDAPPGTSCPVIEAVKKSDFCILVTEPTPFGLNDLILAVEVARKLKISFGVVINRSDLGDKKTDNYCKEENIPVLMRIPFKKEIAVAYSKGTSIIEALPEYKKDFARPAFFQELRYDIGQSGTIVFKQYRLKIIEATNEYIKFVVLAD